MKAVLTLSLLWIVSMLAGCSKSSVEPNNVAPQPKPKVISIKSSADTEQALNEIIFTATLDSIHNSSYILWDFGDSTKISDTSRTAKHSYQTLGSMVVRAYLLKDSTILGVDSIRIVINAIPNLASIINSFKHVKVAFCADNKWSESCVIPDFNLSDDSLIWNSNTFTRKYHATSSSHTLRGSGQDQVEEDIVSDTSTTFTGSLAADQMTIESATMGTSTSYSDVYYQYSRGHSITQSTNSSLVIVSLRLRVFSGDSARYECIGSSTQFHAHPGGEGTYLVDPTHDHCDGKYGSTDWNSATPVPSLTVTFYK